MCRQFLCFLREQYSDVPLHIHWTLNSGQMQVPGDRKGQTHVCAAHMVWYVSECITLAFQQDSQPRLKSSQENKRRDANQIVLNTESAVSLFRIVIVLTL